MQLKHYYWLECMISCLSDVGRSRPSGSGLAYLVQTTLSVSSRTILFPFLFCFAF
ncbi:hypothetical protein BDQ94DRAFT_134256 [Aspergillus welwitschiae]|uniref:Uncharacterized protein n=1 Tax=Aspergillus welwitschiae TaxID=1341132 RepID=A0A3F3QHI5_9EURO|nr:hypothetical protein BDQ94DRAFT_134256 [Aspergillus welwitschiae]RDH38597.1 hypothetical protein BDQ94DRAFT_134256 [Aspergillus welwitschiae]